MTYDLAIAKNLKIQATEPPKYDNVFVNLGAFHIEMAFFRAIGKYIAQSGGPYLVNQSSILEKGSLKRFITGKSYNRCGRIHQMLAEMLLKCCYRDSSLQGV